MVMLVLTFILSGVTDIGLAANTVKNFPPHFLIIPSFQLLRTVHTHKEGPIPDFTETARPVQNQIGLVLQPLSQNASWAWALHKT